MKSNLESHLTYKNEVKSIMTLQQGSQYGFVLEIESKLGNFYCPIEGYRSKELAFRVLRERLKNANI